MVGSIRLGKVFGIPILVHYTWFIVFALIALSLSTQYFPSRYPDWSHWMYWAMGIATGLLLFISVLIHELAHSLLSIFQGIPVQRITLFLFGGVASISKESTTPLGEFLMALAGPVTSLIIAGGFGFLWLVSRFVFNIQILAALSSYLGIINLSLALFNLIPGFPLDGGRLLRSFLWGVTGNYRKATELAITAGRAIAFLFIVGGLAWAITGHWLDGIWLAFIGWFLDNAAAQSYRQIMSKEALRGVKVRELMSPECSIVPASTTLNDLVYNYILPHSTRCFFVKEGERLKGMVTLHNLKLVPQAKWPSVTVAEITIPLEKLLKVKADDEALDALELMVENDVNQMPVVEGEEIVGLIRRDHLLQFIRTRLELGI